jgi:acetylornithine deacetylase/succinyl-diaminopimelate desuccinylase-like protein
LQTDDRLTAETTELLQHLIRTGCVNDGRRESGQESRNTDLLTGVLEGAGLDVERFEPVEGRASVVARIEGSDPTAPTVCLMGHTDVVPAVGDAWREDPFGGELIDGEVWGRGAVDMLCLTASMAVATRHLADTGFAPRGTLVFLGVADEEAGGAHGAEWLVEHAWDAIGCDVVLTETGGQLLSTPSGPKVVLVAAEKGIGWRRMTVRGTPGHGSMPWRSDNALVTAAEVVRRLAAHQARPEITRYWRALVESMGLPEEQVAALTDPGRIRDALDVLPEALQPFAHACTHMTFSPNTAHGGQKANTIPDEVVLELDVRTLPGQSEEDVRDELRAALGDLYDRVEMEPIANRPGTESPVDTPMWDLLQRRLLDVHPGAEVIPSMLVGGTDAAFFREKGVVAYGAGVFSERATYEQVRSRYHGIDERIDVGSLALQTALWVDLARSGLGGRGAG